MDSTQNFGQKFGQSRIDIKNVGNTLLEIKTAISAESFPRGVDKAEMIANITLAYRHIEDAAMRVGKTIQAFEGGKNIYDNNDAARVASNGPVLAGAYANGTTIDSTSYTDIK